MRIAGPGSFPRVPAIFLFALAASAAAQPVIRTIPGNPLTIRIAGDASMQVVDTRFPYGVESLFRPQCLPGVEGTADAGVLVRVGDTVYGPDFAGHPCGGGVSGVVPWTAASISPVTGDGSGADPFRVVAVASAGSTGLQLTETLRYSNGTGQVTPTLGFRNVGTETITWRTYLGFQFAFLSFPILELGRPGVHLAFKFGAPFPACGPDPYRILLPAADRYTGNPSPAPWSEISAGDLSNTLYGGCPSEGVATEWTDRTLAPGQSLTLPAGSGISFLPGGAAAAPVPGTSTMGTVILAAGIAISGWLALSRRPGP
jgi:hypothetical protein